MRKLAVLLLLCAWYGNATAQTYMDKDSLLRLLPAAKEDTANVHLYLDIGYQYELNDPEKAVSYYQKARKLSEKLNYARGLIQYFAQYSTIFENRGQLDSALILNKEALLLSHQLKDNNEIGKSEANLGIIYVHLAVYDSAVYHFGAAIKCFEQEDNTNMMARVYNMLQITYSRMSQHDKALEYGKKALSVFRQANNQEHLCAGLVNIGNIYSRLQQLDEALPYYQEALSIAEEHNFKDIEQACNQNIGNYYQQRMELDRMKPYADRALALGRELKNPLHQSTANHALAYYHLYKGNKAEAHRHILEAIALTEHTKFRHQHFKNLQALGRILIAQNNYEAAEKTFKATTALNDTIVGDKVLEATTLLEKQFETEKKEARIQLQQAQLKQKNTLNYILIGGAVALVAILLLSYRNYRHKQKLQQAKIEELETEKQLTATEAILKGEEQERTRLAKDLHDGLGGMLSGIKFSFQNMKENLILTPENAQAFERSIDMLDSSIKEMRRVAHNMMPEILVKYGLDETLKEFCSEIDRSGAVQATYQSIGMDNVAVEQTVAITVYRIVQELVNNAIKHANAQHVLVQIHAAEPEKLLTVTVEDDGSGFDTMLLQGAQGMGWSNIRNRVDFLKGRIDVHSAPDKGTSVLIEICKQNFSSLTTTSW